MKLFKKTLEFFLVAVMVFGTFPVIGLTALAGGAEMTENVSAAGGAYAAGERVAPEASDFLLTDNVVKYNGSAKPVTVTPADGMGEMTVFYKGISPTVYAKSITAPINAGGYEVTVDVDEGENFFSATDIEIGTLIICPTGLKAVYGDFLDYVSLPSGFFWDISYPESKTVGDVGKNKFKVTYTPEDTLNGSIINNLEVEIEVSKADPTYSTPTDLKATYGDALTSVTLPSAQNGRFAWENAVPEAKVGNVGKNNFTVKFIPSDENNYNVITGIAVVIAVSKADPTYDVPTGLKAVYGDWLHSGNLPKGFTWDEGYNRSTKVGNAGKNTFNATYTPADTANYNIIKNIAVEIEVSKATPVVPVPENLAAVYGQTLADVTLPKGFAWSVKSPENVKVGNVGKNSFSANYTPEDAANYLSVSNVMLEITVSRANPVTVEPTQATVVEKTNLTLADVVIPVDGWTWDVPSQPVENGSAYAASFIPSDRANYNTLTASITVTVTECEHNGAEGNTVTVDIAETCTEDGHYTVVCNRCGETLTDEVRTKSGHSWGTWSENGDETFFGNGTMTRICSECGETQTAESERSSGFVQLLRELYRGYVTVLFYLALRFMTGWVSIMY